MEAVFEILKSVPWWGWILIVLALIAIRDIFFNKKHTIQHNFPIVGHIRYMLESIGPELRQYIVANNREELPFNRIERGWIYASAKNQNNYEGFGSDRDFYKPNYIFINNDLLPYKLPENHPNRNDPYFVPCAKVMGVGRRRKPYRPASVINVSAMSFGSLSARAIESLNRGCAMVNAYHNTGEGGLSPYHCKGGDVIFHFGTGYFGVRDSEGNFSMEKLKELVNNNPNVKAIEVKLSQGAKPGKGGVLPGSKITSEIAGIRGVEKGKDVLSPPTHSAFEGIDGLIEFVEDIAEATGLPVGIKSAVGKLDGWRELAEKMKKTGKGPDFITVDGGEGGTGAAPPSFADHVALPWVFGFSDVYKIFQQQQLCNRIVFIGSGKLGFPAKAAMAFAMGVDCINVAREAMMAVGCIQAQICHNNHCPSGVATQSKWRQSGINIKDKSKRTHYYFKNFRKELLEITHSCGYEHPSQINMDDVEFSLGDRNLIKTLADSFGYHKTISPFEGVEALMNCEFLGGSYTPSEAKNSVRKAMEKNEVRY